MYWKDYKVAVCSAGPQASWYSPALVGTSWLVKWAWQDSHLGVPPPTLFLKCFRGGPSFPFRFLLSFRFWSTLPPLALGAPGNLGPSSDPTPPWPPVDLFCSGISTWWSHQVSGVPGIQGTCFQSQLCCYLLRTPSSPCCPSPPPQTRHQANCLSLHAWAPYLQNKRGPDPLEQRALALQLVFCVDAEVTADNRYPQINKAEITLHILTTFNSYSCSDPYKLPTPPPPEPPIEHSLS